MIFQFLEGRDDGVPAASLDQINDKVSVMEITTDEVDAGVGCSVCMENFRKEDLAHQLPCKHLFHYACLMLWLKRRASCPVCRQSIGDQQTNEQGTSDQSRSAGTQQDDQSNSTIAHQSEYTGQYDQFFRDIFM